LATLWAADPAREVKTERYSRTEGKTPAFVDGEVQRLPDAVEASTHTGLRPLNRSSETEKPSSGVSLKEEVLSDRKVVSVVSFEADATVY
jgi:hypothetical protein